MRPPTTYVLSLSIQTSLGVHNARMMCSREQNSPSQPQADRDGQASDFAEVYDASEAHTRMQQELKVMR